MFSAIYIAIDLEYTADGTFICSDVHDLGRLPLMDYFPDYSELGAAPIFLFVVLGEENNDKFGAIRVNILQQEVEVGSRKLGRIVVVIEAGMRAYVLVEVTSNALDEISDFSRE